MCNCCLTSNSKLTIAARILLLPAIFLMIMPFVLPKANINNVIPLQTPLYVIPMAIMVATLLLRSFDCFTGYIYEKNIKFSDLLDHTEIDKDKKERFIIYHRCLIIFLSACLVGILVYYYIFSIQYNAIDIITIAGVTRGIISLYFDAQHIFSRYAKKILLKAKQRSFKKKLSHSPSLSAINGTSVNVQTVITLAERGEATPVPPLDLNRSNELLSANQRSDSGSLVIELK